MPFFLGECKYFIKEQERLQNQMLVKHRTVMLSEPQRIQCRKANTKDEIRLGFRGSFSTLWSTMNAKSKERYDLALISAS